MRGVDILSMQYARSQHSAWHLQTWSSVAATMQGTTVTFTVAVAITHVNIQVICCLA